MQKEIAADPRSSKINVSLNCLTNRSHKGSGSSCGNSLGPSRANRMSASAGESPVIVDVCRRSADSNGSNNEYVDVDVYGTNSILSARCPCTYDRTSNSPMGKHWRAKVKVTVSTRGDRVHYATVVQASRTLTSLMLCLKGRKKKERDLPIQANTFTIPSGCK